MRERNTKTCHYLYYKLYQNLNDIFEDMKKLEIHTEGSQIVKPVLRKKYRVGSLTLPDFKHITKLQLLKQLRVSWWSSG